MYYLVPSSSSCGWAVAMWTAIWSEWEVAGPRVFKVAGSTRRILLVSVVANNWSPAKKMLTEPLSVVSCGGGANSDSDYISGFIIQLFTYKSVWNGEKSGRKLSHQRLAWIWSGNCAELGHSNPASRFVLAVGVTIQDATPIFNPFSIAIDRVAYLEGM